MIKEYFESKEEALIQTKIYLQMAQNDSYWIYNQRQNEANMPLLINKFYSTMFIAIWYFSIKN